MTALVGIHAKLHRVEQQVTEMKNESNRLCTNIRDSIVREVYEDIDKQAWIYRGETPNVPIELSITLGEILYNLRSSLDHLVWQLVLANGQTPGRYNEFPITADLQKWQATKGRVLKGISQRHEAMIGYLQPYTGGINLPFDVSMLRVLDDLCNIEKHRHLILAVMVSKGIGPLELDDSSTRQPFEGLVKTGKIETDKVLLQLNNANVRVEPSFRLDVGFANLDLPGRTLSRTMDKCLRTARGWCRVSHDADGEWLCGRPK